MGKKGEEGGEGGVEIGIGWTDFLNGEQKVGCSFRERETRRTLHTRFDAADDRRPKWHKKDVSAQPTKY